MEVCEVLPTCRRLGISVTLNGDAKKIRVHPAGSLTPELELAIREYRDEILRSLYFREAVRWLYLRMTRDGVELDDPACDVAWRAFSVDESSQVLNDAWLDADLETFRRLLKRQAQEALKAFHNASSKR